MPASPSRCETSSTPTKSRRRSRAWAPLRWPVKTAGDSGKLFGSVTAGAVVTAIRKAGGPNLDKRVVRLPKGHIKAVGNHPITLHVHPDVDVKVALDVVAEANGRNL